MDSVTAKGFGTRAVLNVKGLVLMTEMLRCNIGIVSGEQLFHDQAERAANSVKLLCMLADYLDTKL